MCSFRKHFKYYFFLFFLGLGNIHGQNQLHYINMASSMEPDLAKLLLYSEVVSEIGLPEFSPPLDGKNEIFIKQVGNYNIVQAEIRAVQSNVDLNQEGNSNYIFLQANLKVVDGEIKQDGNSNHYFDFSISPQLRGKLNLIQEGNNHHFERHGSNSIGNDLQFKMTGDSRTIIVRNFQ